MIHIISIGVSKHQNSTNNLSYPAIDAKDIYDLFSINLPSQGYHKLIIDEQATLVNIKTALGLDLIQHLKTDDSIIIYFSGHGSAYNNGSDENEHCLIPFDATSDLKNSALAVNDLKELINRYNCKNKIILIDSCFSGAFVENGKKYQISTEKAIATPKTFMDITGEGIFIFTASKSDETAWEIPDLKHGLFTSFLIENLLGQKSAFALTNILDPICRDVAKYAKENNLGNQTPSHTSSSGELITLPPFLKKIIIEDTKLDLPDASSVQTNPRVMWTVDSERIYDEKSTLINMLKDDSLYDRFEEYVVRLVQDIKTVIMEGLLPIETNQKEIGSLMQEYIKSMEVKSIPLFMAILYATKYGKEKHAVILAHAVESILFMHNGRSGLVVLNNAPEIIATISLYVSATIAIAQGEFSFFKMLIQESLFIDDNYSTTDSPPRNLGSYDKMYYASCFGGRANTTCDHIKDLLINADWLKAGLPMTSESLENLFIQSNCLLYIIIKKQNRHAWPDFGRYYSNRVTSLVRRLKFDKSFRKQVADIMNVDSTDLGLEISKIFNVPGSYRISPYHWESVTGEDFLTKAERPK